MLSRPGTPSETVWVVLSAPEEVQWPQFLRVTFPENEGATPSLIGFYALALDTMIWRKNKI